MDWAQQHYSMVLGEWRCGMACCMLQTLVIIEFGRFLQLVSAIIIIVVRYHIQFDSDCCCHCGMCVFWEWGIISSTSKSSGAVTAFVGSTSGSVDGLGASAQLNLPRGIAVDSTGTFFVAEYFNNRIRQVTSSG